jgi:Toprim-like/CHC2 zinc finger
MIVQPFTCKQAREVDLVDYLATLGHQPKKIRGNDHWYSSPFRDETEPSFKVNRAANVWYDHGSGKGGNAIDFATQFHRCGVREALQLLKIVSPFQQQNALPEDPPSVDFRSGQGQRSAGADPVPEPGRIHVLDACGIESPRLIHYLQRRRIPMDIAAQYCRQVHYELYGKKYFAIGFPNRSGGYELRNEFFKASSSPKDITVIEHGAGRIAVFEGFFDFLSWLTMLHHQPQPLTNFLVLNTLAYFDKALPILEKYPSVQLYLDSDAAGRRHTEYALTLHPRFEDFSSLYRNYKDLNDWLMYPGHLEKMSRRPKPLLTPVADARPPSS